MASNKLHAFRVTMSQNSVFIVVAGNEAEAARHAEKCWTDWGYIGGSTAVKVELAAWGGQYSPQSTPPIPWLLIAARGGADE